jgi:NAD(P)-dependent dehydrogenase (short-subunit alcohol dehydrogenase family)
MRIENSVAFVTGANRGLGLAFAKELLGRRVKKLYAGVRNPDGVDLAGAIPVKFDVTDAAAVAAAALRCNDVTLLVNNAGIARVDASALDPAVSTTRARFSRPTSMGSFAQVRHSRRSFRQMAEGRSSTCYPMPPGLRGQY